MTEDSSGTEAVGINMWSMGTDTTAEEMQQVGFLVTRLMDATGDFIVEQSDDGRADPSILTMGAVNYMVATLDRIWRGTQDGMGVFKVDREMFFKVMAHDVMELMLLTAAGRPMVMTLEELEAERARLLAQGATVEEVSNG
jgi:hypothetical protein